MDGCHCSSLISQLSLVSSKSYTLGPCLNRYAKLCVTKKTNAPLLAKNLLKLFQFSCQVIVFRVVRIITFKTRHHLANKYHPCAKLRRQEKETFTALIEKLSNENKVLKGKFQSLEDKFRELKRSQNSNENCSCATTTQLVVTAPSLQNILPPDNPISTPSSQNTSSTPPRPPSLPL